MRGACENCGNWLDSSGLTISRLCSRCMYLPGQVQNENCIPPMTVHNVWCALNAFKFGGSSELELQNAIEKALARVGWTDVRREVELQGLDGPAGRIDFMVGLVGLEIKIDGSQAAVTRQCHRYLEASVDGKPLESLLLATTKSGHRLPSTMNGKDVMVAWLKRGIM